ncbi:MAG: hypothetical protein AB8F74_18895 [Saprospiraceae bacterium]
MSFFLKRALIVIILLICYQVADAQHKNDVVFLKDGSIYKGEIIEENDAYIYMVVIDGQTIGIPQEEIRRSRVMRAERYLFHKGGRYHKKKGIFWNVQMGGNVFSEGTSEHVNFTLGYRFNQRWSAGAGFGSELHSTNVAGFQVETQFSSFFVYGRYYLGDNRRRPYVYSRLGYGAGPGSSSEFNSGRHSGGFQAQSGLGIHFASRKSSKFIIGLGFHTQYTNGEQFFLNDFGGEIKVEYDNLWLNHLALKFGIEFG